MKALLPNTDNSVNRLCLDRYFKMRRRTAVKSLLSGVEHSRQGDIPPEECMQTKHRIINFELLDILGIEHVG